MMLKNEKVKGIPCTFVCFSEKEANYLLTIILVSITYI